MGVRTLLAPGVRPAALVLEHAVGGADRPVREYGQHGDAAGAVVGGDQVAAREREVRGAVAVHRPGGADRPRNVVADVEGRGRSCSVSLTAYRTAPPGPLPLPSARYEGSGTASVVPRTVSAPVSWSTAAAVTPRPPAEVNDPMNARPTPLLLSTALPLSAD